MEDEPKLSEVLEAVKDGFGLMDHRFDGLENRMDRMEGRMDRIEGRMYGIEGRMDRQEGKLNVIVNVLQEKQVFTEDDKRKIHV